MSLRGGFEVSNVQTRPCVCLSLTAAWDLDVKLPATSPEPHLPACYKASCHDDNGVKLLKRKQYVFLSKSCPGHGVCSQQPKP